MPPGAGIDLHAPRTLTDAVQELIADSGAGDRARPRCSGRGARALRARALPDGLGRASGRGDGQKRGAAMRVAMVSEHASPLAALGEVDAGGQNVHVAALAAGTGQARSPTSSSTPAGTASTLPARVESAPGVVVHHVDAGPPEPVAKDELLPLHGRLRRGVGASVAHRAPRRGARPFLDVGLGGRRWPPARSAIPVVQTFHALGVGQTPPPGRSRHQPAGRIDHERELIRARRPRVATCTDEVFELRAPRRQPRRA